jgi:putative hydrolase of the HAD superfamily
MTKRAVVFDLFGVLTFPQQKKPMQELERLAEAQGEIFWEAYWSAREPYDCGDVDAATYWRMVAAKLDSEFDDAQVAALVATDVSSWDAPNGQLIEWALSLRSGDIMTAILSNAPKEIRDSYYRHDWLRRFDCKIFSCDVGIAKPDPAIFHHCLNQLSITPEAAIFVDDRQPNIDAAAKTGMETVLFGSAHPAMGAVETLLKDVLSGA